MPLKSKILRNRRGSKVVLYVRHGPKTSNSGDATLTESGRLLVRRRAQILDTNKPILIRASPAIRAKLTAREVLNTRNGRISIVKELSSEGLVKDAAKFDVYFKQGKNWNTFLRDWLDGKLSEFTLNPNIVAKRLLLDLYRQYRGKSKIVVNVTHSMILELLIEKLTGRNFEDLFDNRGLGLEPEIHPTEGFILYFLDEHVVTLEFRKRHFDVGKKFYALIQSNK